MSSSYVGSQFTVLMIVNTYIEIDFIEVPIGLENDVHVI